MKQDEELHDKLLAEFRKYFAANQQWLNEGTKAAAIRVRHSLSEIRRICSARRVVIHEWTKEKEVELFERNQKRKAKKAQSDT